MIFYWIEYKKGTKREPQKIVPCWKGNILSYQESTDTKGKKGHRQENLEVRASSFFQSLIDRPGEFRDSADRGESVELAEVLDELDEVLVNAEYW